MFKQKLQHKKPTNNVNKPKKVQKKVKKHAKLPSHNVTKRFKTQLEPQAQPQPEVEAMLRQEEERLKKLEEEGYLDVDVVFKPNLSDNNNNTNDDNLDPTKQMKQQHLIPKLQAYIEPPDDYIIKEATSMGTGESGVRARASIINYFRQVSRQSDLSKPSIPVPYLLPIGQSSKDTYPIPEYLMHSLFHMSNTTLVNTGAGMAAPQFGLNYRLFVLRSEFFGLLSPITHIPYALPYSEETAAKVNPRQIQTIYPKPTDYDDVALSWDNPQPEWDTMSRPPVNVSKSGVDYHDIQQDRQFIAERDGIQYKLDKILKMPERDAKQLALCDDDILVKHVVDPTTGKTKRRLVPSHSFINDYRGYSVPLTDMERAIFGPLLQGFSQQLSTTSFINPRIVDVRHEYWALREGCFSFPNWAAFISRPIAVDVEYETLEVTGAQIPQVAKQLADSALLSSALATPPGSINKECPPIETSGLDLTHVNTQLTKQLEIKRVLPPPDQVRLVTKKATFRDILAKAFMHEYDHLDGINFFDRAACTELSWQPPQKRKAKPQSHYAYPVKLGYAYF